MTETRSLVIDAMRRHGLGGAAVAIIRRGEAPSIECLGVADKDARKAVDASTVFRIASISKTMTAIGIMQLRDQGRFELDDPVNGYLKTFTVDAPSGGADVTFRHLLTHTAGIGELPRVADIVNRTAWGLGKPRSAPADLRAVYRDHLRPGTAAGTKWAYANHGFAVLGQLVEDISGQPFGEYMREHVFDPLGMDSTEYTRTDRTGPHVATGYHWTFGRFRPIKDYDLTILGPGSVLSSITDMAVYAEWLLHGGAAAGGAGAAGAVLEPETLAEMMSPQYSVDPRIHGMGLAFFLDHVGDHRVAGHDGNVPGFASSLLDAPDDGIGVVVLVNTSATIGAHLLSATLLRTVLGVPDPAERLPRPDVPDSPHLWSELVGHYSPAPGFLTNARSWQMAGGEAEVLVRNRRLVVRALSPLPALRKGLLLHAVDESDPLLFEATVDGLVVSIAFQRGVDGSIDGVTVGPPANVILHRRPSWRSSRVRGRIVLGGAVTAALVRRRRRRHRHRRRRTTS